jgi:signal transduction histidine kinase
MIEFALKTLAPLQTNHQFNFNFNDNLAALRADKKLLLQIIENLLTNAIKYSPDGGEILISAHSDESHFYFSVSDHGIGMTEEDVEKIFDRFYRVKSAKTNKIHGLGLGLAICKDLITALDGNISCKSVLGEGSTFTITLPLYL